MNKSMLSLASLVLWIILLATSGCNRAPDFVTEAAGHAISAWIKGPHSVATESSQAVISGPFGNVVIERAQVKVNDGSWTSIPEGVPVRVEMDRSNVRIRADKVTITHGVR